MYDVAVVGGGPAAAAAASRAAECGAAVVLFDEPLVWGLGGGPLVPAGEPAAPFRIHAVDDAQVSTQSARALILCPAATEFVIPVEGWTLPGAAAAGHGLVPATEAARLFGAAVAFRPERGGWIVLVDDDQRTTVEHLYAAGDATGIVDAAAAGLAGAIAAEAALADLGLRPSRSDRRMPAPVAVIPPPAALFDTIPPDCVVCRCENITRAEIDRAIQAGARDLNQLKQFTRCGMGPCQGRICGEAAAELLARHVGGRAAAGLWTARIPLRPVPMAALLGDFDYADIPVPAPAPI